MTPSRLLLALFAGAVILGCGGAASEVLVPRTATITGRVLDQNSAPVRDARVRADGRETFTTNTGAYTLANVRTGQIEVVAELSQDGTNYRGRTMVLTTDGQQRSNGVVIVCPTGLNGSVSGIVRDRDGFALQDVQVYAYSGAGSSQRVFTDEFGEYRFNDLIGGFTYEVRAMARGFRSDGDSVTVVRSENRTLDLILGNPATPTLTPPQNLGATTWVSPIASAQPGTGDALAWAKERMARQTGRKPSASVAAASRAPGDVIVETELYWNEQRFADHLGWGIYRANSENGALQGLEFFADPLSAYYFDSGLGQLSTYSYAVTTHSALYPDNPGVTESLLSNRVTARTLGRLDLEPLGASPLTFRWQGGSGAQQYVVYVFDRFPGVGVDPLWSNEANPTGNLSLAYSGPALASRTYYYLVLGIANGVDSRTISRVGSFVP